MRRPVATLRALFCTGALLIAVALVHDAAALLLSPLAPHFHWLFP